MTSLVVLMMEAEQPEGISARKLVVETAKHNVITAYNAETGLALLRRFPNVDVIFVHEELLHHRRDLLTEVRSLCPDKPLILGSPFANLSSRDVHFIVDSYRPQDLLTLLEREFLNRPN